MLFYRTLQIFFYLAPIKPAPKRPRANGAGANEAGANGAGANEAGANEAANPVSMWKLAKRYEKVDLTSR
jgi:hypothetical protein